jgi:hypothetical protein
MKSTAPHCTVGREGLTVLAGESTVSWLVTPYSLERARRFGRTYHLHLQGRRMSQGRRKQRNGDKVMRLSLSSSVGFLLCLLLDCEDEGSIFPRNVGKHAKDSTALQSRRLLLFIVTTVKTSGLADAASVLSAGLSICLC